MRNPHQHFKLLPDVVGFLQDPGGEPVGAGDHATGRPGVRIASQRPGKRAGTQSRQGEPG